VGTLLVVASAVGYVLHRRTRGEAARAVIDNMNQRIRAWWVMVAVFTFAFLLGSRATLALFALTSFLALREFLSLTPTRPGYRRALWLASFVLVPVQYWLIGTHWYGLFSVFIPVYGFVLLPSLTALSQDAEGFLERSAKIHWGVMVAIYCISHVPALLLLD